MDKSILLGLLILFLLGLAIVSILGGNSTLVQIFFALFG